MEQNTDELKLEPTYPKHWYDITAVAWFELAAEFEAGTEADMYHHKTIYIVHVGDENVIPQVPMTTYDPGESGTYELSILLPDVEDPTTIHVHMDGKVESFDLNREDASEV